MEHFYKNIEGWFDYSNLYTRVISELPENAHIVEIGAYKGCSTAYLAVEIINSKKNIKLDVIDSWNGEDGTSRPPWSDYPPDIQNKTDDIFNIFKDNLNSVWHIINPIKSLSAEASNLYKDKSLDFVFIDANHYYDGVKEDITKWLPKVKDNGIIAGHDYTQTWSGVITAVDEFFKPEQLEVMNSSWFVRLK